MRGLFILNLTRRELASNWKKSGFLIFSVFLGVASLVAITSFSDNLKSSVEQQSRVLKGSDLTFSSSSAFPDSVLRTIDSLAAAGMEKSTVTQFLSMVLNPATGESRLVQVRAISGGFPFYGTVLTEPVSAWSGFKQQKSIVVDESLRLQLNLKAGDTLKIGETFFEIGGFVKKMPGDTGFGFGSAGKVYFDEQYLPETGLIQFGSRVRYFAELKETGRQNLRETSRTLSERYRNSPVSVSGIIDREQMLGNAIDRTGNFLGLVSLISLLLGGIGVASSIHVYIRKKLDTVAVLRCLGATAAEVTTVYLLVTTLFSLAGITLGVLTGIGIQFALPVLLQSILPVDISVFISWSSVARGFGAGLFISFLFALFPLSRVLFISPLQAFRQDAGTERNQGGPGWISAGLFLLFLAGVTAVSAEQAGSLPAGILFSAGILTVLGVLALLAWGIVRMARLARIRQLPYVVRQGLSNLYRPNNQTVTLVLALGFGVFLIMTLYQIQRALLGQIEPGDSVGRPNLIFFDIQPSQKNLADSLIRAGGFLHSGLLPVVPARFAGTEKAGNRIPPDSSGSFRPRSEYMVTYRWDLLPTETVVNGVWWEKGRNDSRTELSVDADFASRMKIQPGDTLVFDILGIEKSFTVTSLRKVDWLGMRPNFIFVMKPGVLERAPQTFITSLHADGAENRSRLQRNLITAAPNIMAVDLTLILETVNSVLDKISIIIRFMGFFCVFTGLIVVIGAVSNGKVQRIREAALLRTVGAVKLTIRSIFSVEFVILGILSSLAGILLSGGSAFLLLKWVFELDVPVAWGLTGSTVLATALLMLLIGWLVNGNLFRSKPLEVLRED